LACINRHFLGFATEIFTDKGTYAIHYDSDFVGNNQLSLDERAVFLAAAISIDIDYFSRSSGHSTFASYFFSMPGGGDVQQPESDSSENGIIYEFFRNIFGDND
jgi:hypothetical protein